ncbi:MAG: DUF2442 domain-containing protein [Bacteroidota bacterium]
MEKLHNISEVNFENDFIVIKVDGHIYKYKLAELSKKLALATDEEKREYQISPSGYGIHWPKIDEDISIEGLIRE